MICPVCDSDMIVVEYHDIELDYCTECRGVWFDSGELELLLKSNQAEEVDVFIGGIFSTTDANTTEKKRKCPLCGKKMKKKDIGRQPPILIDTCEKGHGLWFDGGEIVRLAEQIRGDKKASGKTDNMAIQFLEDFFGKP
jgi:uncharacterized protein